MLLSFNEEAQGELKMICGVVLKYCVFKSKIFSAFQTNTFAIYLKNLETKSVHIIPVDLHSYFSLFNNIISTKAPIFKIISQGQRYNIKTGISTNKPETLLSTHKIKSITVAITMQIISVYGGIKLSDNLINQKYFRCF
jgi:hypothetical protein